MDTFELSKNDIENTLKELSKNQPVKKPKLENNFFSLTTKQTPDRMKEGIITRPLAGVINGTITASTRQQPGRRQSRNQVGRNTNIISSSFRNPSLVNQPNQKNLDMAFPTSMAAILSPKPVRQSGRMITEKGHIIKYGTHRDLTSFLKKNSSKNQINLNTDT